MEIEEKLIVEEYEFVFENVTWPMTKCSYGAKGNGTLLAYVPTYSQACE